MFIKKVYLMHNIKSATNTSTVLIPALILFHFKL